MKFVLFFLFCAILAVNSQESEELDPATQQVLDQVSGNTILLSDDEVYDMDDEVTFFLTNRYRKVFKMSITF